MSWAARSSESSAATVTDSVPASSRAVRSRAPEAAATARSLSLITPMAFPPSISLTTTQWIRYVAMVRATSRSGVSGGQLMIPIRIASTTDASSNAGAVKLCTAGWWIVPVGIQGPFARLTAHGTWRVCARHRGRVRIVGP